LVAARPRQELIADKKHYGQQLERVLGGLGLRLLWPARKGDGHPGRCAPVQAAATAHRVVNQAFKGQLDLERRGGVSGGPVEPPGLLAYAPVPLTHPSAEMRVTTRATVLAPGIALLPPLPAALFWDGAPVLEQALVVNVRGVGLVLVSGCGHPVRRRCST
jgi:hypothetical protein